MLVPPSSCWFPAFMPHTKLLWNHSIISFTKEFWRLSALIPHSRQCKFCSYIRMLRVFGVLNISRDGGSSAFLFPVFDLPNCHTFDSNIKLLHLLCNIPLSSAPLLQAEQTQLLSQPFLLHHVLCL